MEQIETNEGQGLDLKMDQGLIEDIFTKKERAEIWKKERDLQKISKKAGKYLGDGGQIETNEVKGWIWKSILIEDKEKFPDQRYKETILYISKHQIGNLGN